jgi:chromosomal replication initiator protein
VRDLEGVVNSLMAYSIDYNTSLDMRLAERVIKRSVKIDNRPLTIDDILEKVCHHFGVTQQNVFSKSRKQPVVQVRQISMYLARSIPRCRLLVLVS